MATSVDSLISTASSRAGGYAASTDFLVSELRTFIHDWPDTVIDPGTLDISQFPLPSYVSPKKDTTPVPVYVNPASKLPKAPVLSSVGAITVPEERLAPTLDTSGLFQQIQPSSNLPDFNEAEPNLNIEGLVAEMNAIATPILRDFDFPALSGFSLGVAPTLDLPVFDAYPTPDTVVDPIDYAAKFDNAYRQMLPEMQAFIDDKVSVWIGTYAPEYSSLTSQVSAKLSAAFEGGVLPDQFEAALYTRARGRVEREVAAADQSLLELFSKSGFMEPPGAVASGLLATRLKGITSLSDQSTDIYIERRKTEVQHLQFALNLASAQIQGVRNSAISYAQTIGGTMQNSISYANGIANAVEKVFEHLIARAQLSVSIMGALNAQYEIKLKASLSVLEGYKLSLEAERSKTDIEVAKINAVKSQIEAEETNVRLYSALIDAVTRKGNLEELKLKGYGIRADIYKTQTSTRLAEFDMYKASLQGDQAKLEGELSKLKVYDSQLNADNLRLDALVKQIGAVQASNDAKVKIFESGAEVYKLDIETALTKFNAQADVKKLAQSLYGQELTNAIEEFRVGIEMPRLMIDAVIKQYQVRIQAKIEEAKLNLDKLKLSEDASKAATAAYEAMAAAALGSLSSVVSSAVSAVA